MKIPNVEKTILDNGLTIVTENIQSLRSVALGLVVGAGSGDELQGEEGLTHFIEHMAFKGTPKRSASKIEKRFKRVGGKLTGFTVKSIRFIIPWFLIGTLI